MTAVSLREICNELDTFFNVAAFVEKDWEQHLPENYKGAVQRFYHPAFIESLWNGLMLENLDDDAAIERVYLAVFPTQGVIDKIIAKEVERGAKGALIFTHHPLAYSEKAADFTPIKVEQLEELKEHHISLYSCHAPLDCHPEISTANALADALGLEDQKRFGYYVAGYAGMHGTVNPTTFQEFATKLAEICELPALRYDQCLNNGRVINHIAITPGGGGDPQFIDEACGLGADTYITGHWWLFGASEYAQRSREEFPPYIGNLNINLLGASHYSSELIVMRDQMVGWFKEHNLEAIVIRQQDAWG
jgi:putative NIF3 family GTP cyclohydrolase 1 type 2